MQKKKKKCENDNEQDKKTKKENEMCLRYKDCNIEIRNYIIIGSKCWILNT